MTPDRSEALRALLSRLESKETVDPEEYLGRFPELKEEIKALFKNVGARREGDVWVLGDFRILREIGSGGTARVYEAEQVPLGRKVALKVLSSHLRLSDRAVRKFRREAKAGGRQRHTGIVAIHAVGEQDGIHYIAEELVNGGFTLADRLDEIRETKDIPFGHFRESAKLTLKVADALSHAHASKVIHRDIKPSNILITKEGEPKVTDFGLARVEDTLRLSRTGDFAGTPFYMSPEQVMSRKALIDHRTDVYSLGVTLYECLTLQHPFEGKDSRDVMKKIFFHEPSDPRKVEPRIPRDLAFICLKAMEKEPKDRYASMEAFADDLRRFLHGEVIKARPAGPVMRIRRRMKRNRALSAVAALFLLALVAFTLFLTLSQSKIAEERNKTAEFRDRAGREEHITSATNALFQKIFSSPYPGTTGTEEETAEVFEKAVRETVDEHEGSIAVEYSLRNTLGMNFRSLGLLDRAEYHLRAVLEYRITNLGEDQVFTQVSRNNLAVVLSDLGRYSEAESLYEKVLADHRRRWGDEHLNTCLVWNNLATLLYEQGKYAEAEPLFRRLFAVNFQERGPQHEETLRLMTNLGMIKTRLGRYSDAEPLLRRAWEMKIRALGADHKETVISLINLAEVLVKMGRLSEGERMLDQALAESREILGKEHPETLLAKGIQVDLLMEKDQYDQAESKARDLLEVRRRKLGEEHPDTLLAMEKLAGVLDHRGVYDEAEKLARGALDVQRRILGDDCPNTLRMRHTLAKIVMNRDRSKEAETILKEIIETARESQAEDFLDLAWFQVNYGQCLSRLKRLDEAEIQLVIGCDRLKAALGEDNVRLRQPLRCLAELRELRGAGER